ncbi:four helix bundle protein [Flavobacterium sp.]|uniref:four helix bundle protein n=1 Tax=Flavobacterium sp. TaxID=239 RepID=UPI0026039C60|nr:four helix bundle protein [Flavobacterium sp.]
MHQFEKLKIWQKSMDIAEKVYNMSVNIPTDEKYNLVHQIKKCAVSIPSNIAEGSGRNSKKEFIHFLGIANGSAFELITQLILLKRLNYIEENTITNIVNDLVEVCNMSFALQRSLKQVLQDS